MICCSNGRIRLDGKEVEGELGTRGNRGVWKLMVVGELGGWRACLNMMS